MAVPIFVWNGTAWESTGPTIPANPIKYQASAPSSPSTGDIWVDSDGDVTTGSQQFQRFRFVASGGETTISGADANGAVLAYTAGLEQVVLNGAVLVRGFDYTATTGTSITGLSPALVASDVLEVFSFIAFTVANTYTQSQVDGLVTTATAEPGMKLIVPTSATNGTVSATGAVTFTTQSSVSLNEVFSSAYDNYFLTGSIGTSDSGPEIRMRLRVSGSDNSSAQYRFQIMETSGSTAVGGRTTGASFWTLARGSNTTRNFFNQQTNNPFSSTIRTSAYGIYQQTGDGNLTNNTISAAIDVTTSYTGFTIYAETGTMTGTIRVYGYKN